ncbi:MAG: helix-turn-helix transcriptional regulator [Nitrospinae bacterium]|nr:helix-turn-helix transcriptional regulator [Nitrospinota bacterium]
MKALKRIRRKRGLSFRTLAVEAGVHYVHLVRLEGGKSDPRLSTLRKLAKALEVSVCDLIDAQPPPTKERRSYGAHQKKG